MVSFFGAKDYKQYIINAKLFFNKLMSELNKKHKTELTKESFIFLPGNHEIYRDNAEIGKDCFERYKEFLDDFYEDKTPSSYNLEYCSTFHKFENQKVVLVGFNSAHYEVRETDKLIDDKKEVIKEDYGWISSSQLSDMTYELDTTGNYNGYTIVAVLHHHFYLIEERYKEYIDNSTLRNHEEFLTYLNRFNLKLILHGHKHENTNRRLIVNSNLCEPEKIVTVIGSGSSNKQDVGYNSFNYIEIFSPEDCLDIKYNEFVYGSHSFQPNKEIVLPLMETGKTNAKILDEFRKSGQTYREYIEFQSIDTDSFAKELIVTLDKTVGSIKGSAENIFKDPKIVFYLLIPIHYRCGIHKDSCFINELKNYCNTYLEDDFNTNTKKTLFYKILSTDDIMNIKPIYEELVGMCSDREVKYLRFLMISIFMVEFHITLRLKAEVFYNNHIKYKSNISVNKGALNLEIPGTTLEFKCDEERRSVGVYVKSKTANAHKIVSLIIKEFELLLKEYDDDFFKVGFNIYYTVPLVTKMIQNGEINVESYNFNAYIPTLIPLLAGENLYSQKEAFARELIQNSIDAIGIRKKKDGNWNENGCINIRMGQEGEIRYFEIEDDGAGMNRYIIERYFTCIGRSYYKSEDYEQLKIEYIPISMFGIGFLSCFIIGNRVDVCTKYFSSENNDISNGLRLEIPNFDGCFFIENSDKIKNPGTIIKIYEDKKKNYFCDERITNYIRENINNIPVDVNISNLMNKNNCELIPRFSYIEQMVKDTKKYKLLFFSPFKSGRESYKDVDIERFYSDQNYRFINSNGIYIFKRDNDLYRKQKKILNSAGIKVQGMREFISSIQQIVGEYFDIYVNFSSDMVNLDVSRSEINKLEFISDEIIKQFKHVFKLQSEYYTKERYIKNLPYFILREINNEEFGFDKVSICVDENQLKIMLRNDTNNIHLNSLKVVNHWLELFHSEGLKSSIQDYWDNNSGLDYLGNDKYLKVYNAIQSSIFFKEAFEIEDKKHLKWTWSSDIDKKMVRDISRVIDRTRIRSMARDMTRDMTRIIERDMERVMERSMDRKADLFWAISRDMNDEIDRLMTRARDMAILMNDMQSSTEKIESVGKLITYIYIFLSVNQKNREFRDDTNNIIIGTLMTELISVMFLTLEDLDRGLILDINRSINII